VNCKTLKPPHVRSTKVTSIYHAQTWVDQSTPQCRPHRNCPECTSRMFVLGEKDESDWGLRDQNRSPPHECFQTMVLDSPQLTPHMSTVSENPTRPHRCVYCGLCFKRSEHLKRHVRRRTSCLFDTCQDFIESLLTG
jgi:hypothetical protein